jgi:hypothetical protein
MNQFDIVAHNGSGLADVLALAFRLLGKLLKSSIRTNTPRLFICRYIGKPMLAVCAYFFCYR